MNKEQNFVSAVVAITEDGPETMAFFERLYALLDEHFCQFELIAVNESSGMNPAKELRAWGKTREKPLTIINMSLLQMHEQCMNAGLDCAIGDYVFEFDDARMPYDPQLLWKAYTLAQEGNDIVSVCPSRERWTSRLFYRIFNRYSNASYPLRTNAFHLVTRRALNRVHSINENLPYRKAAYAACGLKMATLEFEGSCVGKRKDRFSLATDSLVLYTDFGYKFSVGFTALMLATALIELIYTLVIWLTGHPIAGWTTTMFVITFGMTGLFAVLAILLKYMTLLLRIGFKKQSYLVESIEKM